ncbi:hypothetical protein CDAR_205151 [Caerostris darwini]|uniref:Uncharacterized protein n=1 Tax=Caerostris darwini TaxID=1538125 RepID=A0AAV4VG88_9ARAC|nr:hypothetical protein CDAR_205151 [Caerostris darwini]
MVSDMKQTRGDSWKRTSRQGCQTVDWYSFYFLQAWVGWIEVDGAAEQGGGSVACDGVAGSGLTFLGRGILKLIQRDASP